jgi:hypothetical protein
MKRVLVLLAVLLSVCWFAVGCEKSGPPGGSRPTKMSPEDKQKMDMQTQEMQMKMMKLKK